MSPIDAAIMACGTAIAVASWWLWYSLGIRAGERELLRKMRERAPWVMWHLAQVAQQERDRKRDRRPS